LTSIAIVRLSALGDIVHTLPAMQRLRLAFPQARIDWLVQPPGDKLLDCFSGIDRVIPLDLRSSRAASVWRQLRDLRRLPAYETILDFQGLLKSAWITHRLKGERFGFHASNLREKGARFFYDRRADPFPEDRHVIRKNLHLLTLMGIREDRIEFPEYRANMDSEAFRFLEARGWPQRRWVLINVGGGWPTKVLSPAQWVSVIQALPGLPIGLLWGNETERRTAETIHAQTRAEILPGTGFPEMLAMIGHAGVVVSADTLALHLADLCRTVSVSLFGPTSPTRNGSLDPASISLETDRECRHCHRRRCDRGDCMAGISTSAIAAAVNRTMEDHD